MVVAEIVKAIKNGQRKVAVNLLGFGSRRSVHEGRRGGVLRTIEGGEPVNYGVVQCDVQLSESPEPNATGVTCWPLGAAVVVENKVLQLPGGKNAAEEAFAGLTGRKVSIV